MSPPPTATATATSSPTSTKTATATPTPTGTATPTATLAQGANISFFGLASASDLLIDASGVDGLGRLIFELRFGSSFELVIEGRPGSNHRPVGFSAFDYDPSDPTLRPDLQVLVSQPLGNGSALVCDNVAGNFGGVPPIDPPDFSETQTISDAMNDLGCRFNDGTGNPVGRGPSDACTLFSDGEFRFVQPQSTVQFCGRIAIPFSFPIGDTIVTARLRDTAGVVGPAQQIVVRINPDAVVTPPPTHTPLPTDPPTPTPTQLPPPGPDADVSFLGLASVSDQALTPSGVDDLGRAIYELRFGRGFNLVVEGRPLVGGANPGTVAFAYDPTDPAFRPDLQVLVSRPLGDGSSIVCDNSAGMFGGVPAVDPVDFSETQMISDAINDFGCRFNDGTGNPSGRTSTSDACTGFSDGTFHFIVPTSTVQFCALVTSAYGFPEGDTIVTARFRNGPQQQIVVRVTG